MTIHSPRVMRWRLSRLLTRLREESGLDASEVARRLDWSPSKITSIERDQWRRPSPRDVGDLLDTYRVDDPELREKLLWLARQARARGWWFEYRDVLRSQLVEFEAGATAIRSHEVSIIPGLLQIADYARGVFEAGMQDQVDRRVAARMRRQQILGSVRLTVVIDEAAIRRQVGGRQVMARQLRHLVVVGERPNIEIRVLPDEASYPAMGEAFLLLDFGEDDPTLLYMERATEAVFREEVWQVSAYTLIFDRLVAVSMSPEASRIRLAEAAAELEGEACDDGVGAERTQHGGGGQLR
jgi:transcriptional regulator with XRE-family HTH domain